MAPCPKTSGNVSTTFSDIESDEDPRKNELGEEIDDDVEENTVLPVNIEMQNYRGRGRRRVRNNIKQIIEKVQNETHSKRNKKKGKVEKDEATRFRHNKMERERRDDIRNGFLNLASVMNISTKYSNVSLLDKAFTMITDLEEEDRELVIIEKELTRQNEILEQNLQSYKNILNGH